MESHKVADYLNLDDRLEAPLFKPMNRLRPGQFVKIITTYIILSDSNVVIFPALNTLKEAKIPKITYIATDFPNVNRF
jgi:hypothetical protein